MSDKTYPTIEWCSSHQDTYCIQSYTRREQEDEGCVTTEVPVVPLLDGQRLFEVDGLPVLMRRCDRCGGERLEFTPRIYGSDWVGCRAGCDGGWLRVEATT